ncbi:hypothetical protein HOLleu_01758 [Holothuria leucospilota]|uniref:Uncharacterized protein n=1 Tax=Holothuria leucospilota TaxID=206669 RepID=A0A9Q1CQQ7_HOLLE|nr:hypothetical protein HOLleu_01758 [Holothuria leucospilota]
MIFNNYKCNNHHNFNIYINGDKLELVKKIKFLGVIIDSKLTWQDHIHYLSSHVAKGVDVIDRLKYILPRSVLRTLYFTVVYPHLTYCRSVWSSTKKSNLNNIYIRFNIAHDVTKSFTCTLQKNN